jgi:hypothetical protein
MHFMKIGHIKVLIIVFFFSSCGSNRSFMKQKFTDLKPLSGNEKISFPEKDGDVSTQDFQISSNCIEKEVEVEESTHDSEVADYKDLFEEEGDFEISFFSNKTHNKSINRKGSEFDIDYEQHSYRNKKEQKKGTISFIIGLSFGIAALVLFVYAALMFLNVVAWVSTEFLLLIFGLSLFLSILSLIFSRIASIRLNTDGPLAVSMICMFLQIPLLVLSGTILLIALILSF